ncbi:MAG: DMT family transporter, partial [Chloroflexota bacterium]|nr:DMT family transporter [Chloroflexota bacterium]
MQLTGRGRTIVILGLVLLYAVCSVAIKAGLGFAPPLLFAGLRAVIGGMALLGLALALRQPVTVPLRLWPATLLLAVLATSVTFAGMFLSPGRSGAAIASVLGNVQPLIVIVLAAAFLKEPLSPAKLLALGLGTLGVLLIS